ncbi:MAG: response regulator [Candidatus Contendobacter sp.]
MNLPHTSMVYIVDADPALRDALQGLLESVGLRTLACADAEAFLAAYRSDWPGCLLLDAEIPGCKDLSVQQHLREQHIDVPVIMMAAHADVAMAVTALRQGALDFIEKPFNDQILLDGVHHALTVDAARQRAWAQHQDFLRRFDTLTAREQDVLRWVVEGLSNREIAEMLNLSHKTVEVHRAKVMRKMRADTLSQLIRMAVAIDILKLYEPDA